MSTKNHTDLMQMAEVAEARGSNLFELGPTLSRCGLLNGADIARLSELWEPCLPPGCASIFDWVRFADRIGWEAGLLFRRAADFAQRISEWGEDERPTESPIIAERDMVDL